MATPMRMDAQYITEQLGGTWRNGKGMAPCSVRSHKDRKPSLSITEGDDGKPLVYCHAGCSQEAVIEALKVRGLWPKSKRSNGQVEAIYDYPDETGKLLYQIVRKPGKKFLQRYPDGGGRDVWKKHPRQVLYRLPEVLKAKRVFIVEGEKDANTLCRLGLVATTNAGGAKVHWLPEFTTALEGTDEVVLIPDDDSPGWERVLNIARALIGHAAKITIAPPAGGAKDVTEWCETHPGEKLRLGKATPITEPADVAALEEQLLAKGMLKSANSVDRVNDGWPVPEPLADELPPVEAFSLELLPASFRCLASDIAERMQVPLDFVAASLAVCLAGTVNRRATIQPKANDTDWVVVPNLWGGIIALPGLMKTPVIQAATRPLKQIQTEWRKEYAEDLKNFRRDKEEFDLRWSAWKDQYKQSAKKGKATPDRPEDAPEEPKLRRLIVNDATFEALHETMSDNPAGILVIRDELTGWWSQLDRAGREGERAFCLQAWNGDTGHTIDRIGRGTIHVEACCMSMLGGIQPGRLRSYLVDALTDGPGNDGMIQRFQLLVWPDTDPDWEYVDRPPAESPENSIAAIFGELVTMSGETPTRFRFEPKAQKFFVGWLADLEAKVRTGDLHPALTSHLSKFRALMPTLALLFELADRVVEKKPIFPGDEIRPYRWVRLAHAQRAADWCRYLESHARRIYSCVVTPQLRAARELAAKLKQRKIGSPFVCSEIYLKGWSGLDTPEAAKRAVEALEDLNWVRRISDEPGPRGGRPKELYEVNPAIYVDGGVL